MSPSQAVIHVAGDPTVDWFLLNPTGSALQAGYQWDAPATVRIVPWPGGAAILTRLLSLVAAADASENAASICGVRLPDEALRDPRHSAVTRTFTVWDRFPVVAGSEQRTWRIHAWIGQEHGDEGTPLAAAEPDDQAATCVVLDDTNLGFRGNRDAWPVFLRDDGPLPAHVILRMTNPLASGPLWDALVARCPERLTLYFSAADLRKEYAAVGQPLSWERTSTELVQAIRERPDLASVARVIVSLGVAGAILVSPDGQPTLVFDPASQEGDWERRRPGDMVGVGVCVVAGLAYEAARSPGQPDWAEAVTRGLQAARTVHEHGFELVGPDGHPGQGFPDAVWPQLLPPAPANGEFERIAVPDDESWDMCTGAFPDGYAAAARRIVVAGADQACRSVPVERMGLWSSLDRTEIESMRSVRGIVREYLQQSRRARPLSIAVFGPPGSGKSFAIKQLAREWAGGPAPMAVLEFNLSQFGALDELPRAFQRVRDCAVEGVLPLVFWDEFDSALGGRELGWLASFLAPMQDGQFVEGGAPRPIGPAIFVFAGGTHETMASFKERATETPGVKATDFLSRLRGFVDILGPNPTDAQDRTFVLRRAFQFRAFLLQRAPQLFRDAQPDIDPGILHAFLHIDRYLHGARSMESLIDMSALSGRLRFERSALPARHQLSLHVDPERFLALVRAGGSE